MSEVYLKKAEKTPETGTSETRKIVERMLSEIEIGKETIAKKYASDLDGFNGDIIVSQESIENASKMVPEKLKDDIKFAKLSKVELCIFFSDIPCPGRSIA